jgi:hypothetical protein
MGAPSLAARLPAAPAAPEEALDRFLGWVADLPLALYPAQ